MTQKAFWAGVFPGHGKVCAGALRSAPCEQYEHYGVFRVRCDTCGFDQCAGVSVAEDNLAYTHVDGTENMRPRAVVDGQADGQAVRLQGEVADDH